MKKMSIRTWRPESAISICDVSLRLFSMNIQVDAQLSGTRYYLNMSDSNLSREIATEKHTRDVFNLSLHSKLCNIQVNVLSSDAHLRIPNNEIWIIVLDDFQPAWDFAWILHKNRETQQDFF